MKKAVAVLLTLALLLGSAAFASEEAEAPFYTRMYDLFILRNIESSQKWPLFFRDGADDMPWIDLEELADMANFLENEVYGNKGFHLSYYQNGSVISLEREDTGLNMAVDFEENTITFGDYDGFVQKPGMGSLLVNSVYNRDIMVVQGCMVVMGLVVVIANFLVDISYGLIDPRVRSQKGN